MTPIAWLSNDALQTRCHDDLACGGVRTSGYSTLIYSATIRTCVFIEDDKLPTDVVCKEYSESRHALCCLNCGFESEFAPHLADSIGRPLYVLMPHDCPNSEAAD